MGIDGTEIKKKLSARPSALHNCPACDKTVSKNAATCPHCGEPLGAGRTMKSDAMSIKPYQVTGGIGSVVLGFGVFSPLLSAPIMGNINYFKNGEGDGIFVLAMAAVTLFCIVVDKARLLWITGAVSLGMILFTFYTMRTRMSDVIRDFKADLAGEPFDGFADMAISTVNMQWGWGVLLIGAGLIIAAAALGKKDI